MRPQLVRTLTATCRDAAAAEELAQETLVRAWERWDRVSTLERPEAWCHRVAMNLSHSRWRRVNAETLALARVGAPTATAPDTHAPIEDRDQLASLTHDLSEQERRVLALRHVADLSVDEVAELLDCPPGTVTSTASRATAKVRATVAAAVLVLAALVATSLLPQPAPAPPVIVDVTDVDGVPTVLPDGYARCETDDPTTIAFCDGDGRITLQSGPHAAFEERGTAVPVGPRTGYAWTRPDGRIELTVSDRTSSADLHYRVLATPDVSAADLARLVESIPAYARIATAD